MYSKYTQDQLNKENLTQETIDLSPKRLSGFLKNLECKAKQWSVSRGKIVSSLVDGAQIYKSRVFTLSGYMATRWNAG